MKQEPNTHKILHHYITRILLGFLVCFLTFTLAQAIGRLLEFAPLNRNFRNLVKGIIASVAVIYAYSFYVRWSEKRKVTELARKGAFEAVVSGTAIGVALQVLTIGVMIIAGDYKVIDVNAVSGMIIPFTVAFSVAIFEEILLRGILLRILEERFGSFMALVISATVFGALHLFNPGSNWIPALYVGIEGGLLMGAAYLYSRTLWFPIAIHFAWNFMQSGIFGAVTSGNEKTGSLLNTRITGSLFLTGGTFGPEGSTQAVILCAGTALILFRLSKNKLITSSKQPRK